MRRALIPVALAALLGCNPAFAQVGGVGIPTPGIAATSPLGMAPGSSVSPTGIPMGATEIVSPGISPMPSGTLGMSGYGITCSATGSASPETSSASTYDGGGMGMAGSVPGSASICGTGSASGSSTAATPSMSPSAVSRPGIPLGSVEIGSAGISPLVVVPMPSASPSTMGILFPSPSTVGTPTAPSMLVTPTSPTTGTTGFTTNQSTMPCGSIVTNGPAAFC
jgi:hypothetical protein